MEDLSTELINCPLCDGMKAGVFAEENGFRAVKCDSCGLIYVNPRPSLALITEAVKTGVHNEVEGGRNVVVRRLEGSVALYRKILAEMFPDFWQRAAPISWIDVGAGYGEFIEAVSALAPEGSTIVGLEPMLPKAIAAQKRGLNVQNKYLSDFSKTVDVVSLINVFSHLPDVNAFLGDVKRALKPQGVFFIETGNIADLASAKEVPTELDLPDHLVFAGEKQLERFLTDAGFVITGVKRRRKDTFVNFAKNVVKKTIGRQVSLAVPYTSPYRSLLIRAKLKH